MIAVLQIQRSRKQRMLQALLCALLGFMAPTLAAPTETASLIHQIKVSYLLNFLQFVKWPLDSFKDNGKFNLCVVDGTRFRSALATIVDEHVRGRAIEIHHLAEAQEARSLNCQLLFMTATSGTPPLALRGQRGLLTVGERPGFLQQGGIINLIDVGDHVRFEVDQKAARDADLVISSRLLALAVK